MQFHGHFLCDELWCAVVRSAIVACIDRRKGSNYADRWFRCLHCSMERPVAGRKRMKGWMKFLVLIMFVFLLVQVSSDPVAAQETRHYVQSIQSEDFSELEGQLTNLAQADEKDTDGMSIFHRTLNRISNDLALDPESSAKLLDKWCLQKPSHVSFLIRGLFYIEYAWNERGSNYADKVLPEVWQTFKDRLWLARNDLLS